MRGDNSVMYESRDISRIMKISMNDRKFSEELERAMCKLRDSKDNTIIQRSIRNSLANFKPNFNCISGNFDSHDIRLNSLGKILPSILENSTLF